MGSKYLTLIKFYGIYYVRCTKIFYSYVLLNIVGLVLFIFNDGLINLVIFTIAYSHVVLFLLYYADITLRRKKIYDILFITEKEIHISKVNILYVMYLPSTALMNFLLGSGFYSYLSILITYIFSNTLYFFKNQIVRLLALIIFTLILNFTLYVIANI